MKTKIRQLEAEIEAQQKQKHKLKSWSEFLLCRALIRRSGSIEAGSEI